MKSAAVMVPTVSIEPPREPRSRQVDLPPMRRNPPQEKREEPAQTTSYLDIPAFLRRQAD